MKKPTLSQYVKAKAREYVIEVINENDGNVSIAALHLGISRKTIYRKMESLDINFVEKSDSDIKFNTRKVI